MICDNITINPNGNLEFAGQDVTLLAQKYGTPLYLMDEQRIRKNCQTYYNAMKSNFGDNFALIYASKANSFKKIYNIVAEEGLCVDVVSLGEVYTAQQAGFPLKNAFFHCNNKTDSDIEYAIKNSIGYFVVDCKEEIVAIDKIAGECGIKQNVLLRLTPGIDTHTYEAVNTGKVDSKFGTAIETGQAESFVEFVLTLKNIKLCGFHCHIGSMVFDSDTFLRGSEIMLDFIKNVKDKFGYATELLDLGGGYGVRYVDTDPCIDIAKNIAQVADYLKVKTNELGIALPKILMEPGRSIVADAGMTIYTVGSVKEIPGYKNYTSIDGGMSDNPRYALYQSQYTVLLANKMNDKADFPCDLVGRCCESGDIIQPNIKLPKPQRGDIVAVCTTGAYNYSMASNYNRIPRPPIVMLNDGNDYVAVRRESLDDIVRNDI